MIVAILVAVVLSGALPYIGYWFLRHEPRDTLDWIVIQSIDIVQVTDQSIERARATYPDAEITANLPSSAWANIDLLFETVLDTIIESVIEQSDSVSRIHITMYTEGETDDWIIIQIVYNGSSISVDQDKALFAGQGIAAQYGNRLGIRLVRWFVNRYDQSGLWLVKWFVDHYGGELRIEADESRGSTVTMKLPAANVVADEQTGQSAKVIEQFSTHPT